jgi:hypothetical protein
MTGGRGAIARRLAPALVLLAGLLIVAGLWWIAPFETAGSHDAYFALLRAWGVPAFRLPFLDTHGVLAVIDCHRRGVDVYVTNPCDMLGRVHVYTPLWFRLAALPIEMSATPLVGCILALAFTASLVLLPPGRDGRAASVIGVAAVSPTVAFAIERGNADVLMFVLATLAAWVVLRRLPTRLLAVPIVLLAAGLKLYPATLLILALRERLAWCLAIGVLSLAALFTYIAIDAAGLREMLAVVPGGTPFIYSFGARNLAAGLGLAFDLPSVVLAVVYVALLIAAAAIATMQQPVLRLAVQALTPAETAGLMVGAVLILGCFLTGQSGEYRAVHLLFVLPALTALAGIPGAAHGVARRMVWVTLLQLWGDVASAPLNRAAIDGSAESIASHAALLLWLAREIAWWWMIAMLLSLLAAVVLELPSLATPWRRRAGPT